jgi:glycosyltransferase involved in cell wall biosynthesis
VPEPVAATVAILLKGYPRLSETFVVKELLGMQERGLRFVLVSLRHPTDRVVHDLHERVTAPVTYLPEYLHHEPLRVLRAAMWALGRPRLRRTLAAWLRDLARDPTPNRVRRLGQALVLARELPAGVDRLHAHFIHTPGSVARYASRLLGLPFSLSAHARDIWTIPAWEKREKLADATWTVTCTGVGARHLHGLAPGADIELLYHGVDTERFAPLPRPATAPPHGPAAPPTIVSVARCVPKKGLDTLVEALARLPAEPAWRHLHVGGGPLREGLVGRVAGLGLGERSTWLGSRPQLAVVQALRGGDLFCLPARIAADGDRDGLPNVLMEAMAVGLPVVATRVGAIPELVEDGRNGLLVTPDDAAALAGALARLLADPELRARLGRAGRATVVERFGERRTLDRLASRFGLPPALAAAA